MAKAEGSWSPLFWAASPLWTLLRYTQKTFYLWTSGWHRSPLGPAGQQVGCGVEPKTDSLLRKQAFDVPLPLSVPFVHLQHRF